MQRILMAVLPLLAFAAVGCDFFDHKEKYYTYCDATGCYTCDQNGCSPQGTNPGGSCRANQDCAPGCYCSGNQCTEPVLR